MKKLSILENKLKEKDTYCPFCKKRMILGYIGAGTPIFWGEKVNRMGGISTNRLRTTGFFRIVLPSLRCSECGIILSQYD
jgi:hypothetical protein